MKRCGYEFRERPKAINFLRFKSEEKKKIRNFESIYNSLDREFKTESYRPDKRSMGLDK